MNGLGYFLLQLKDCNGDLHAVGWGGSVSIENFILATRVAVGL